MPTETRQSGHRHGRRVPSHRQLPNHQQQDHEDRARRVDNATLEDQCHPRKFFLGGLAPKTTTQDLCEHFAAFGPILDAVVLRWPDGRSRGFGYVTFSKAGAAAAALQTTHYVGGRQIDIKRAVPGTNKVFVGGLPKSCTAAEMREHFEAFGVVSDAAVMMDPVTHRSRGFGFICFLPGPEGSESVAAVLAEYSNHKIRGKWIEVKSAVSPHLLASNDSSSSSLLESRFVQSAASLQPQNAQLSASSLLESPKSQAASAVEQPDAQPILLTPRTQVPLHWRKKPMAQDSSKEDFCQPWKVPVSLATKTVSVADPPSEHSTLRRAKNLPVPPACDLAATPWPGNAHGDDAVDFSKCYSEPAFLPTPAWLSDARTGDGSACLSAPSEALKQTLAELFRQESVRFKEVQATPTATGRHGG